MNAEKIRLLEEKKGTNTWSKWGPYLSDRQWGTVREDYSQYGTAWDYFSHDIARSRAYRWGEDGIAGISDIQQLVCFSVAMWNGKDPIIKERFFGLTGSEGNHGEDVKEYYYYLDNTPTHSYMRMLYKYPQNEFPYSDLININKSRSKSEGEYELIDTGIFNDDKYFDVFIEYAKVNSEDILIKVTAYNRGNEKATLHLLPQIWFRNTWDWGYDNAKPEINSKIKNIIELKHKTLGRLNLFCDGNPQLLFCENETNTKRVFNYDNTRKYFKDGINDYLVHGNKEAVNPENRGTKAAIHYELEIPAGEFATVRLRLDGMALRNPFDAFENHLDQRKKEADAFYRELQSEITNNEIKNVQRQAFAGMLWAKQFFYFDIPQWLNGDPAQPAPPKGRKFGRNKDWFHLNNADIISMPDKWEYPWYAAWDLAFHCIPLSMVDAEFAKNQLLLLTKEWYMHPNGQLPAYEWAFGDVNPPVHAWASWRVYKIDQKMNGTADIKFLEEIFHKLLLNFTWWVNRKDTEGHNLFQGGFLGLDNIGVFDRSSALPTGGHIEQADGTSWMAMYCLNLLRISLELSKHNKVYQSTATKFFEHFLYIAGAMANIGDEGINLWDDEDEFFYDVLHCSNDNHIKLKVRSMVGLIPLFAVEVLEPELMTELPEFSHHAEWFLNYRPDLASLISKWKVKGVKERKLLSLLRGHRMKRILKRMLDETEFLSDYGIRALSKHHLLNPYVFNHNGSSFSVSYQPAESDSGLFGGNSNWRGPIWFPVNYLIIESLQKFHHYYGEDFKVEYPTNSGNYLTLEEISDELSKRLANIFLQDEYGNRAVFGSNQKFQTDPNFKDYLLFHEYFDGDNGRGVGASHQTGWTGLIAKLLQPRKSKKDNQIIVDVETEQVNVL